jgi:hypothetical protein
MRWGNGVVVAIRYAVTTVAMLGVRRPTIRARFHALKWRLRLDVDTDTSGARVLDVL